MLIGIDASRANRRPRTGVEWYSYHLLQHLKHVAAGSASVWRLYTNHPLQDGLERFPANWQEERLHWPLPYLWTQARLSYEMMQHPPDVLFVPAHVLPRLYPKKSVVTIHDIGFRRLPQLYKPIQVAYHEFSTREIVKQAARIITVSEFSKQELVDAYHADPARVFVTPLGLNTEQLGVVEEEVQKHVRAKFLLNNPFFFFSGRWEAKKNILGLMELFEQFTRLEPTFTHDLVLAGLPGSHWDEIERAYQQSSVKSRIRFIGYVNETEKAALLSAATAYIHAAWYEGFGLPPLEAMACGCPVVCANTSSLPEVVGRENALWFEPKDPQSGARALQMVCKDRALVDRLRVSGFEWIKQYTWQKTAERTLPILTDWS